MASSSSTSSFQSKLCYYQILRVSRTASALDIKTSFRRLALQLHPDQHGGCPDKHAAFTQLNQAYQVLSNAAERAAYDQTTFGPSQTNYSHKQRQHHRPGMNPHYRKVYATQRPPPEWEFVWNHAEHQEMHYGLGMQRLALQRAMRDAKAAGVYQSPLGRGFSFETLDTGSSNNNSNAHFNPYSKRSPQGPPKISVAYEQGDFNLQGDGRMHRRERIIHDMGQRRSTRHAQQQQRTKNSSEYQQYRRYQHGYSTPNPTFVASPVQSSSNAAVHPRNDCVIL